MNAEPLDLMLFAGFDVVRESDVLTILTDSKKKPVNNNTKDKLTTSLEVESEKRKLSNKALPVINKSTDNIEMNGEKDG